MSPRVTPREQRTSSQSSYAEFRSRGGNDAQTTSTRPDIVFWRYLTGKPVFAPDSALAGMEAAKILFEDSELRVLSKASSAAGGYLVPNDFGQQITSARRARNVIGELARNLETDHGRPVPLPTATAHGTGVWTAENAAVTATDETFGQISLNAFKGMTKTFVSEELAEDAIDEFDQYLADELGQRLALLEEQAFAVGDGTGKPLGIAHASSGITVVTAATGSATAFKLADVRSAWASLPDAYKPSASWIMSPTALASLATLTDTAGALVLPSLHNTQPSLYGAPVYSSPELPAAAANAKSVVVGDFSLGYAVRRVRGLGVQRQVEIHSDSGQIGYRLYSRCDGRVVLADALRVLAHSAT
jgi:HK97 family phage major capsid protein